MGCTVHGCPAGLGEPVFGKLQARLAMAMMSINAAKGFEYGTGFASAGMSGSDALDHHRIRHSTPHRAQYLRRNPRRHKHRRRHRHAGGVQAHSHNDASYRDHRHRRTPLHDTTKRKARRMRRAPCRACSGGNGRPCYRRRASRIAFVARLTTLSRHNGLQRERCNNQFNTL